MVPFGTPTATTYSLFLPIAAYRKRNGTLNFEQHGFGQASHAD